MAKKLLILTVILLIGHANAAPTKTNSKEPPPLVTASPQQSSVPVHSPYDVEDIQLLHPHVITLERFESLLRRAGELFRPGAFQLLAATPSTPTQVDTPYQQMQPPDNQPYNFYLPLYQYEDSKLDEKSRKMEKFTPPPESHDKTNYYAAVKPKKMPKKFNAAAKHVNVRWLNAFEKQALADNGEIPKAVYLTHDERNRINFDDSFFGADVFVRAPDNEPHKEQTTKLHEIRMRQEDESYLNQGESEMGEEDLLAAPAMQVPHFSFNFSKAHVTKA